MGGSSMVPLNRTSSIENEPRTLNLNQIQFARDAALYVINTRGLEEAMKIFTEGLEPVSHCVHDEKNGVMMECSGKLESLSSPLRVNRGIRDIATAPF
ncbi:unnamed protein product [Withania somnifera]